MDGDVEKSDGDVSSGHGFYNSHTLSQCEDSSTFKEMDGDFEKGDVISGYISMDSHIDLQNNGLESFMTDNDRNDKNI